jgi:hypothetical protein
LDICIKFDLEQIAQFNITIDTRKVIQNPFSEPRKLFDNDLITARRAE